jgi:hypothetical protein
LQGRQRMPDRVIQNVQLSGCSGFFSHDHRMIAGSYNLSSARQSRYPEFAPELSAFR